MFCESLFFIMVMVENRTLAGENRKIEDIKRGER